MQYMWPSGKYSCVVVDPPWPQKTTGKFSRPRQGEWKEMPYRTMTLDEIKTLPVSEAARVAAHLWLWTTNRFLREAFDVMETWGFTYLTTITWCKPSGFGAWFVSTTQHCLFGYYKSVCFHLVAISPHISKPILSNTAPNRTSSTN